MFSLLNFPFGPLSSAVFSVIRPLPLAGILGAVTLCSAFAATSFTSADADQTIRVWDLNSLSGIGGNATVVLGSPQVVSAPGEKWITFDGEKDGVIVLCNPIQGWSGFTIEVLFSPATEGPIEQRFLHIEDESGNRALLELRLMPEGKWCLDTFLLAGKRGLPLIDRSKLHSAGQWHWVALVYDGKKMSHFVNGIQEVEGEISFPPTGSGRVSLGMRLNRVSWFKGAIREVRFHALPLSNKALQRVRDEK